MRREAKRVGQAPEAIRQHIPKGGVDGREGDVLMRATIVPNTVQRWMLLAIPVGLVVGLWCVVKGLKENGKV
jgi:hypothetical protein